jgi:VanZ family protein
LNGRHRSSAGPLTLAYAALIVYASLYPFTGWRWPHGLDAAELLALPWPPWRHYFDIVANVLGYLPAGALLYAAAVRGGASGAVALALAVIGPALLSFTMEVVQTFVPSRVPSRIDWVTNSAGAAIGALLAALLNLLGAFERWQAVRERWFAPGNAGALALLLLWPCGLLFPAPVPLGLGQIGPVLQQLAADALEGTPWSDLAYVWPSLAADAPPLSPPAELLTIALGLLAPCMVAFAATSPGWRRVPLAVGAALLAVVAMTLSTALNFAPEHALTWLTPVTLPALVGALIVAALSAPLPRRVIAGIGLIALTGLVVLVAQAPADPYYAESLQGWEQGRFIRFHGVARWIGWLWPYLAMAWLLLRLGRPDQGEP